MRSSRTPSAGPAAKAAPLTPAEQGMREKNLAHLLIVAHREGVPAAIQELRRRREEKRTKAHSSPRHQAAIQTFSAAKKITPRPGKPPMTSCSTINSPRN